MRIIRFNLVINTRVIINSFNKYLTVSRNSYIPIYHEIEH